MKKILLFITILTFLACDPSSKSVEGNLSKTCEEWTHPSSTKEIIQSNPGSSYNLGQVLSIEFRPVPPMVGTAWSAEALKEGGYDGENVGFVKVNIPEAGDYIVWITAEAFISPYLNKEDPPLLGGDYIGGCEKQKNQGGYLKAVSFSLKAGINTIQFSHSPDENTILTVTKKAQ